MELVHLRDLTDEQWHDVYQLMFDPRMAAQTGVNPAFIENKPSLVDFYRNLTMAFKSEKFNGWAIMRDGIFKGYTVLDKTQFGEWEVGTILLDPDDWGGGMGVRAALQALKWAFEKDNAEWVVAKVQNQDPKVERILQRGGFRAFSNILLMDKPTWNERWKGRI